MDGRETGSRVSCFKTRCRLYFHLDDINIGMVTTRFLGITMHNVSVYSPLSPSATQCRRIDKRWRGERSEWLLPYSLSLVESLFTSWGNRALSTVADLISSLLSYSRVGIEFMFGQLAANDGPIGFVFAINVLPVVIFFSAFIAVMYHLGIMMWIVRIIGGGLRRCIGTSHAESTVSAANIFIGQANTACRKTRYPMTVRVVRRHGRWYVHHCWVRYGGYWLWAARYLVAEVSWQLRVA